MGFSVLLSFLHLKDWKVLVTDVCVKFNNSQKTTNFQKIVSLTFIKLLLFSSAGLHLFKFTEFAI